MLRFFYSLITLIVVPVWVIRLVFLSLRNPDRRKRLRERFAFGLPQRSDQRPLIWIHAVSVGEVAAAEPLIKALLEKHDEVMILLTTMTPTGSQRAQLLKSDRLLHCYLPYDIPAFIRRLIRKLRPSLLILMETELWPNLLFVCEQESVPALLANGRLSERSARRYALATGFTRQMLATLDMIAAQSGSDAERFLALGASGDRVAVTGSLKFHITAQDISVAESGIFASIRKSGRPVLIAASTRAHEEEKVLGAFTQMLRRVPNLLLLLVPRHTERFEQVGQLCQSLEFHWQRRSKDKGLEPDTQIVLGDSMYELARYYACADLAFVGGSLVDTGCQNVLEPAAQGLPIITGPSQFNFKTICEQLEAAGALVTVADADGLASTAVALLSDEQRSKTMGEAGKELIASNQQALPEHLRLIDGLLGG